MSSTAQGPLAAAMQPFIDKRILSGAVFLIANKDRVLGLEAAGYADIAAKKPMQTDSLFWVASQTKAVTGTAVTLLIDEGKLSPDDPIEKYLPEFKGQMLQVEKDDDHVLLKKPNSLVTVRHVLSHTSGFVFSSPVETPTLDMLPLRVAVKSYAVMPLQSEPGTKYAYSNAGTNTAARLIEVVTGMSYHEFVSERLFRPLGMADTTHVPTEAQLQRLAKPYKPNADKTDLEETTISQLHYPLSDPARHGFPAGGLFASARDCGRFCQMILNRGVFEGRRYLSEAAVSEMTRKQTGEIAPENYGYGWSGKPTDFGHGGALGSNMWIHADIGLVTVWLIQGGRPVEGQNPLDAVKQVAFKMHPQKLN